jgi:hypothetical protein
MDPTAIALNSTGKALISETDDKKVGNTLSTEQLSIAQKKKTVSCTCNKTLQL